MMEQIKKMYEEQKRGRIKAAVIFLMVYFFMIGIVSIFYGNPFPYKEKVIFIEIMQSGWIRTHGYLLLLCAIIGLIAGIGSVIYKIIGGFRRFDRILLQECDTKEYLEIMEFAVSYGKELNFKGFQRTVFLLVQKRYVLALIANWKLEEAEKYLNVGWNGNKSSRLYRETVMNFKLIGLYHAQNKEGFQEAFKQAGKAFEKNKLFIANKLFLEEQYEKAAEFLNGYEEKMPYNEVNRNYLLGRCYDKLGNQKLAEECMKYTIEHGNMMPCKKWANEWLMRDSLKLFEQKEE